MRNCANCHEPFEPTTRARAHKYCSPSCRYTHKNHKRAAQSLGITLQEYQDGKRNNDARARQVALANQRYANQRKIKAAISDTRTKAEKAKAYYEDYYARNKDKFYRAAYKRRALIKGSQHEHIERYDVFNRDNWRCRVCNVVVSDTVKRGHPRKAIMAHIVALAAGGPHTWDNVCCLCHSCNSKDGVNQLPIQTTLPMWSAA